MPLVLRGFTDVSPPCVVWHTATAHEVTIRLMLNRLTYRTDVCGTSSAGEFLWCDEGVLDLIRFGGHLPKGGYDVHNGGNEKPTAPSAVHG